MSRPQMALLDPFGLEEATRTQKLPYCRIGRYPVHEGHWQGLVTDSDLGAAPEVGRERGSFRSARDPRSLVGQVTT